MTEKQNYANTNYQDEIPRAKQASNQSWYKYHHDAIHYWDKLPNWICLNELQEHTALTRWPITQWAFHHHDKQNTFSAYDMNSLRLIVWQLKQCYSVATEAVSSCPFNSFPDSRPAATMKAQKTSPRLRLERNVDAQLTGSLKFTEWSCKSSHHVINRSIKNFNRD